MLCFVWTHLRYYYEVDKDGKGAATSCGHQHEQMLMILLPPTVPYLTCHIDRWVNIRCCRSAETEHPRPQGSEIAVCGDAYGVLRI